MGSTPAAAPLPSALPSHLARSIASVLETPAASSFSLTAYLNTLLPSAAALTPETLAGASAALDDEAARSDAQVDELVAALRARAAALEAAEPGDAETVPQLMQQLEQIREKASQSEAAMREITREINALDRAKRNVVGSMTALKRLWMLVNAVSSLSRLTSAGRYAAAAESLAAVESLRAPFATSYEGVERLRRVTIEVEGLRAELEKKARGEWENNFASSSQTPNQSSVLLAAAQALDALGPSVVSSFLMWYTNTALAEYRRIFRPTDEAGQLDNVSRRYAYFRRILKTHDDEREAAFPPSWRAATVLMRRFAEMTREDVRSALIREGSKLKVETLLEALNATIEFETAMSRRFSKPFAELTAPPSPSGDAPLAGATGPTLSSAFDPHLGLFVEAQDKVLADMFATYRRSGPRASIEGADGAGEGKGEESSVLPSSTELFYFYRLTLEQCARLSTRQPFRDLCSVFARYLRAYADEILRPGLLRQETARRSVDARGSTQELQRVCRVLNTADYCKTTAAQLEEKLREKIHPEFREGVDLEGEQEAFVGVISAAIANLAREVEIAVEPPFSAMLRPPIPWSQLDQASGKSQYVDDVAGALEHVAVVVRQELENKRYVRSWSDKVVGIVLARFTHTLVKLKPLQRNVAQQLLLDIREIQRTLLELPRYSLAEEGSTAAAASYQRYVSKGTQRLETLLEILALADDGPDALIDAYVQQIGDRSSSNFQKVLDLRGVRRVEQNALMDAFVAVTSQSADLTDTSFLTSLDMDPPANAPFAQATTPTPFLSFGLGDGTSTPPGAPPRHGFASPDRGAGSGEGGGAARAFGDLRRFGSMLVGRKEESRGR